jgi:uncharacterized RDD family membrane protein YckC
MNTQNPYAPPRANVSDVAASDELEPAGRGTRFGAVLLDGVVGFVAYLPLLLGGMKFSGTPGEFPTFSPVALGISALLFIALIAYTIVLVARNGQTIGKKLLNIKVVRSDGSKASLGRIFWLRNVVNGLLGIIPFYGLVDALFIFGEARQCVHDKIADTIVVVA